MVHFFLHSVGWMKEREKDEEEVEEAHGQEGEMLMTDGNHLKSVDSQLTWI